MTKKKKKRERERERIIKLWGKSLLLLFRHRCGGGHFHNENGVLFDSNPSKKNKKATNPEKDVII